MLAFYRTHHPDKVDKVDRLLEKYKNNLDDAQAQFELGTACLHDADIPHHSEW